MASLNVSFTVGEKFSSYEALMSKIVAYQTSNSVQLYKRSSRSLEAAKTRCPNKKFNEEIKFWELTYSCIHGGKTFKKRGNGSRNQSTFQMDCKAEIRFHASADGNHLEVKYVSETHNHEKDKEVFRNLFQQRRLDPEQKKHVCDMLDVKANKKMIQNQIMSDTGKVVLLKDIHNLGNGVKSKNKHDTTILQRAVDTFMSRDGAFVELLSDENKQLQGLFFQDARMRTTFAAYPEFLCVDATYKVNDLRMPLYVLLVENGNGQSEIVAMWLVCDETEEMMTKMVQLFKAQNSAWQQITTVMSDKDFVEREVFSREIPNAQLRICLFHTLRTFRREITAEKTGVSPKQRLSLLEILQKLTYSRDETEYQQHYQSLTDTEQTKSVEYFNQHWHTIRKQWVIGLADSGSLGNQTNNRLESINQKIKQVVDRNAKFDDFASDICAFLDTHRTEIDGKMYRHTAKVPVTNSQLVEHDRQYRQLLTNYAYRILKKEMERHRTTEVLTSSNGGYTVKDTAYVVTTDTCSCTFRKQYALPCRHILALRVKTDKDLYAPDLVAPRWTRQHFLGSRQLDQRPTNLTHEFTSPKAGNQSQQQRYRTAFRVAQKLASCAAEETRAVFDVRMKQLNALLSAWEKGENVVIQSMTEDREDEALEPMTDLSAPEQSAEMEEENVISESYNQASVNNGHEDEPANSVEEIPATDNVQVSDSAVPPTSPDVSTGTQDNENTESNQPQTDTSEITLPPNIKKRGRPKGSDLTVIGLPKKRLKLRKIISFNQLSHEEKVEHMLSWFVGPNIAQSCVHSGRLVRESEVETRPEKIHLAVRESNIQLLSAYCEADAWTLVKEIVENKKTEEWKCVACNRKLETRCVGCDLCLHWYHFSCAGITTVPKTSSWFCRGCRSGDIPSLL